MKTNYKIILFISVIISFFLPLGLVPLFNLDEGAFSEATREMLVNHDFITTYLNGNLRFDKPILIYWCQALSVSLFGLNEFALRLPSAIAGSLWVYSIFWFTKLYFREKTAFLAAFFMLSSLQIGIIAKAAIADSLLNMAISFSMFFIWLFIDKKEKKYLYFAFAMIGIGTLTKGPVSIMIPLVVTFIYLLIKKDLKLFFSMIFNIKGITIFLLITFPWYFLEYQAQGMKFIDGFLLKHNIQRFDSSLEHHKGSIFYYIPVLLIGLLPFTLFIGNILKKIKQILQNDLFLFLSIWFIFVFIFFSFSGTKLPHYIIYGYTPIFILMAIYFKKVNIFFLSFTLFFILLLFFIPNIAHQLPIKNLYAEAIIHNIDVYFNNLYKVEVLLSFLIILSVVYLKIKEINKIIIVGLTFSILVNFVVIPAYAKMVELPIKEAALISKKNGYNIVMYGLNTPSFMVYSQKLVEKRFPKIGDIVITKNKNLHKFKKYKIIYHKDGIYLIKVEK